MVKEELSKKLGIDEARLSIQNQANYDLVIQYKSDECYRCSFEEIGLVAGQSTWSTTIDTRWPVKLLVQSKGNVNCSVVDYHFKEYGDYWWTFTKNNCGAITLNNSPKDAFIRTTNTYSL
ncbi:DgyrCDS10271 [Dimorphilus gyrociliatus]|uniref:DgyrCDS10271 n=1 Tax=Dimorphilus gyrociliatus TaxID=2664684 RepID=A0A7I8W0W7_9ANNE|nr:DgyrCDS10271 [Dimorphilus gyrociliatus]